MRIVKFMKFAMPLLGALSLSNAYASGGHVELADVTIDPTPQAIKAGAQIVLENCVQCHSLKYIKYRHLKEIGFTQEEIDKIRGDKGMNDSLERGMDINMVRDMFGLVPPDLSLMAKARKGGGAYIYSLLTAFHQNESGNTDNSVFPGIRMPDVMSYSFASTEAEKEEIQKSVKDVSAFLVWASDPNAAKRESIGVYVIGYLLLLTVLYYLLKKRIWATVGERQRAEQKARQKEKASGSQPQTSEA